MFWIIRISFVIPMTLKRPRARGNRLFRDEDNSGETNERISKHQITASHNGRYFDVALNLYRH